MVTIAHEYFNSSRGAAVGTLSCRPVYVHVLFISAHELYAVRSQDQSVRLAISISTGFGSPGSEPCKLAHGTTA